MAIFDLPGKTILMHNRFGIRIELNFDQSGLMELWLSPGAGKTLNYRDRNFSNRDDHTRLFDRISFPDLGEEQFLGCEYDPFYSVIRFQNQTMHVATLFDSPLVVCWFDREQQVDIKSDKQDRIVLRDETGFVMEHPDRGRQFTFGAILEAKGGHFRHQIQVDEGRSTYCRAELQPGCRIAIAGELSTEPVVEYCQKALGKDRETMLRENEAQIAAAIRPGSFKLRGRDQLQNMLVKNKRVLLAMQDASGAIRAALNRIYYMIWVRDGAIIECYNGYTGWTEPLRRWTEFLLENPTEIEGEEPSGKTFLMLVNQITKWEEDGIFYAIWSAFTTWTQTGDPTFITGPYLERLEEAMDWLERRCYHPETGLFQRYFACESPFPLSRDDGFDGAVGIPQNRHNLRLDGKLVKTAEDLYINTYAYNCYLMLAAMTDGDKAENYLAKARHLAGKMEPIFSTVPGELPPYGRIYTHDGSVLKAANYGLDMTDHIWGCSVSPFYPMPGQIPAIRRRILQDLRNFPNEHFLAGFFSACAAMDPLWSDQTEVLRAFDYVARQCHWPGKYLAMPDTVKEFAAKPDGDLYHDVRPQAFSIGPWLAAVTGLGIRRLPFGLAIRATEGLEEITDYEYRGSLLHIRFSGNGLFPRVTLNRKPLNGTYQLPESLLQKGENEITVAGEEQNPGGPVLIGSTIRLWDVIAAQDTFIFQCEGYGVNVLEFLNGEKREFTVTGQDGRVISYRFHTVEGISYLEFDGKGRYCVEVRG